MSDTGDRPVPSPTLPGRSRRAHHSEARAETAATESFDVRFWKIRVYKGKRGRTYAVRWTVASQEFHQTYGTSTLADSRLAELRTFARNGTAFDVASGFPVPEVRRAQEATTIKATELTWYALALRYVARRWEGLSPNSRRSVAETLATVTPVLLIPDRQRPDDDAVRHALYLWAFRNQPDPPEDVARVLSWVAEHSQPISALADDDIMLDVLDAIARKLDGSRAAANTIARKRAVLSNVLDYAVGRGLDVNPLPKAAKMWNSPKTTEGVVDPQVVVNRRQAEELLIAVSYQGRIGPGSSPSSHASTSLGYGPAKRSNFAQIAALTSPTRRAGERSTCASQRRPSGRLGQRLVVAAIPGNSSTVPRRRCAPFHATPH